MIHFVYLAAVLLSLGCLVLTDWRWKLAFFANARASLLTMITAVVFFIVWDASGIVLHIFFVGNSHYLTGLRLAPQFPIEELFFLCLLVYTTLLAYRVASK